MHCTNVTSGVDSVTVGSLMKYQVKPKVSTISPQLHKGIMVSSCCGSLLIDLEGKNEAVKMMYVYPPNTKTSIESIRDGMVMGLGVWINTVGIIPDSGEDTKSVYDSVIIDGEKVIFQYRKCE